MHLVRRLHLWLLPPSCRQCGRLLPPPGPPSREPAAPPSAGYPYLCAACHAALPWLAEDAAPGAVPDGLARVVAACRYGDPLSRWIQQLKYERQDGLVRLLADLWRETPAAAAALAAAELIVPVPLHPWRLWRRGFNQSLLLAHAWLRHAGAPAGAGSRPRLAGDVLVRHRNTRPQVSVSGAERRTNVVDAFSVHPRVAARPEALQGRRVLLIDDVTTTGATLTACAQALRAAGAGPVQALVLARA